MPAVDVDGEMKRVESSLQGVGLTSLASGGAATLNKMGDHLRDGHHDILYLVCHGTVWMTSLGFFWRTPLELWTE